MMQWRSFFANCDADIWTVIEKAIILAASDYPKEFKNRRSEIAETLFSRVLLDSPSSDIDTTRLSGSGITNATNLEENGTRDEAGHSREGSRIRETMHALVHNDGVTLNDEENEEASVMKELHHIKEMLKDTDQSEKSLLEFLQQLENMQVTVEMLKATEIGRHVNVLRKHPSKRVRSSVKLLVSAWKDLVDEWVKTAGDHATAAISGSGNTAWGVNEQQGLMSFPHVEGDLLAASTASVKINQFLSYTNEDMSFPGYRERNNEGYSVHSLNCDTQDCTQISKVQLRGTDTLLSKSDFVPNIYFNGQDMRVAKEKTDIQTYLSKSDFIPTPCYNDQDMRVTEERGSSNRVDLDNLDRIERRPESDSRHSTSYNESITLGVECKGRASSTAAFHRLGPGKVASEAPKSKFNGSSDLGNNYGKNWGPSSVNKSAEDMQTAQKLEIARRRLHEGYQQAENAKKQRTAQRVDPMDLPKEGVNRENKLNGQSKPVHQNLYRNQNRK